MFNIIKRRDFMLASDTATAQEAEQLLARYDHDYIVVKRADIDPGQELNSPPASLNHDGPIP